MARPGKEQVFFLASLGLTGLLGTLLFTEDLRMPSIAHGKPLDLTQLSRREVARAPRGSLKNADWTRTGREAFREPRDWLPLPPAELERPPLRDPSYVPPPPRPAAGLPRLGIYRIATAVTEHAFPDENGSTADAPADNAPASVAAPRATTPTGAAGGGAAGTAGAAKSAPTAATAPSPDEVDELKKRFDWLDLSTDLKPWYVIIENEDKFGLLERPNEPLKVKRIDPKTNRVIGGGQITRDRVKPGGLHFAATAVNTAEMLLRELPEASWSSNALPKMLDSAEKVLALGQEDPAAWRGAATRLERWIALDPKSVRTYELLADAHAFLLDYEKELATLKRAEAAGLESAGIVTRRARWLRRVGARTGALERLAAAAQRFPSDRGVRLAYGRALLEDGAPERVELALQQFQQAENVSETKDQRIDVIAEVGAAQLERGDATAALAEAKRILGIEATASLGLRLEGAAELALARLTDAEGDFQRLLSAASTPKEEAEALLSIGTVRTRLKEFDQARIDLRRVPQIDPLLGGAAGVAEADLLAVTDHLDAAVVRCRDAATRAPDDVYVHYFLGRLLRQSGDLEGARGELRRALELGSGFPDLFNELGFLALAEGRAADARRYYEESLAREESAATRLQLAHADLLGGELGQARTLFEGLPTSSESLLGLAYCAYKRGESEVAQQLWTQVKDELKNVHADDKAYATRWLKAVLDLESKQVWEDGFLGSEVGNGWTPDTRFGLDIRCEPGMVQVVGSQKPGTELTNIAYLARDVELALFHEYEVDVSFEPDHQGRIGFGLSLFVAGASGQAPLLKASLALALDADGTLQLQRCEHVADDQFTKIGTHSVKPGDTVRLTLRRKARGSEVFQFFLDGELVGEPIEMQTWKGKSRQQVAALFFASAPGGKKCDAKIEHARRVAFLPSP